jgi:hypothetical protein
MRKIKSSPQASRAGHDDAHIDVHSEVPVIDSHHAELTTRRASLLAAGLGGAALVAIALPLLVVATVWPGDFDGNTLSDTGRVGAAAIALCLPVGVTATVTAWRHANVRISTLLVAVPEALAFAVVLLWFLLTRG